MDFDIYFARFRYIENYETILQPNIDELDDFLDHPLNAYQAIKHLSREWTDVHEIISFEQYLSQGKARFMHY